MLKEKNETIIYRPYGSIWNLLGEEQHISLKTIEISNCTYI